MADQADRQILKNFINGLRETFGDVVSQYDDQYSGAVSLLCRLKSHSDSKISRFPRAHNDLSV